MVFFLLKATLMKRCSLLEILSEALFPLLVVLWALGSVLKWLLLFKSAKGNPGSRHDCDQFLRTESLLVVVFGREPLCCDRQPLNKVSGQYFPLNSCNPRAFDLFLNGVFFSLSLAHFFLLFLVLTPPSSPPNRTSLNIRRSRGPRKSKCWTVPLKQSC